MGYLYAALQVIGFAIGGIAVYGYLKGLAYCEKCSKHLVAKESQMRYTADADKLTQVATAMRQCAVLGHLQEAIAVHATVGDGKHTKDSSFRSQIEIKRCKACNQHWMKFAVSRRVTNDWKEISEVGFQSFTDEPITASALRRTSTA